MREFKITERYTPRSGRALQKYLLEVKKSKVLAADKESELIQKIQEGDDVAREKLIMANLRFVISVAKSYTQDPELFSELIAVGNIGLVDALKYFDPSRGFKFISYAVWYIQKEMLLFLYESSRTVRIPTNKVQQLKAIKDVKSKLVVTTGRDISMEEAIEHLKASGDERFKNFDMMDLDFVLTADNKPHSLNSTLSSDGDSITWEDVIPSQIESPEAQVMKSSEFELLMDFLHVLDSVEKEIVLKHHGLNGQLNEETFESISAGLGISSQYIRQKYKKSLKKLKIHARKSNIKRGDFNYQ
jgi:RNA polymerase primary sigma factor